MPDQFAIAKTALGLIDLTTLTGEETAEDIRSLCERAQTTHGSVAAVCLYPQWIELARTLLPDSIRVATVCNFPDPSTDRERVRQQIAAAVTAGADEIDVVFPWKQWLVGKEETAIALIDAARDSSGTRTLKVIIESGSVSDREQIARITTAVIAVGADFIKTSTGKTEIGATIEAADAILRTIRELNPQVGFKASGGISTCIQATEYLHLATKILDEGWITPQTFRFGASSLIDDVIRVLDDRRANEQSFITTDAPSRST